MTIKEFCKSYKNLVSKWTPRDKNSSKHNDITDDSKEEDESLPGSLGSLFRNDEDESFFTRSSSASRRSRPATSMQRKPSRRSKSATRRPTTTPLEIPTVSKMMSQGKGGRSASTTRSRELEKTMTKQSTTPIVSPIRSVAKRKPLPVEMELDCTLEELCFGSIRNVLIKKVVVSDAGIMVQEEETLTITVQPGWNNKTRITFEGKGDEKPGYMPANIVFSIREKSHPLYERVGDDLELVVEVPLEKALTGCTISLPLLGGENMTLQINDVISTGFKKAIAGQGMSIFQKDGRRGDLIVLFDVLFPESLSDEQRSDIRDLLVDCDQ